MDKHPLQQAFEDHGHEVRSYSGRGMYGEDCLGVDGMSMEEFTLFIFELGRELCDNDEEFDDIESAIKKIKTDSMGLGTIIYFPKVHFFENVE